MLEKTIQGARDAWQKHMDRKWSYPGTPGDEMPFGDEEWAAVVRGVLEALREPDDRMMDAPKFWYVEQGFSGNIPSPSKAKEVWQAMIDVASHD